MANIGVIAPPTTGHIHPLLILAKALKKKGHRLVFFNIEDLKEKVEAEGIDFVTVGKGFIPNGAMKSLQEQLGKVTGMTAMRTWQKNNAQLIQVMCFALPPAVKEANIDFLLVDQSDAAGGSVAQYLNIPYITVIVGNSLHWEESLPPVFAHWQYANDTVFKKRNLEAMHKIVLEFKPIVDVVNQYRKKWGLPHYENYRDMFPVSDLAQIVQMPEYLDFPREEKPSCYFYTGPFRGELQHKNKFPYDLLNGKPIIYASLGTVVNEKPELFLKIAQACLKYDAQLVISTGSASAAALLENLPGKPLIVPFAPQFELMKNALLCITHAGLNTVMDALGNGVPLLAIPISFDQPGTAARIKYHQLGEVVLPQNLYIENILDKAIHEVLMNDVYKKNALAIQQKMQEKDGVSQAISIIEGILAKQTSNIIS